ncbi:hypothetical protein L7F22_067576 [Adiantum nelumboides]|nr:hypothetical protein [Adiantum nelumboides]
MKSEFSHHASVSYWILIADRMNKDFFAMHRGRPVGTTMRAIRDGGGALHTDPDQVLAIATEFYEDLFTTESLTDKILEVREQIWSSIHGRVTDDMRFHLMDPFTIDELRDAVHSLAPSSCPGDDDALSDPPEGQEQIDEYVAAKNFGAAVDLLQSGASVQLRHGQVTCGVELGILLVESLGKARMKYDTTVVERIKYVVVSFPRTEMSASDRKNMAKTSEAYLAAKTRVEGFYTFMKAAIRWCIQAGGPRRGPPELHDILAEYMWTQYPELQEPDCRILRNMRKQNDKEDPIEDAIQKCKEEMQLFINKINRNLLGTIKTLEERVTGPDEEIARLKKELQEVRLQSALEERQLQPSLMEEINTIKEQEMNKASAHFVRSGHPEKFAKALIEYMDEVLLTQSLKCVHFIVITDHHALKCLLNKPQVARRVWGWLLLFQEFDVEVVLRLGKHYVMADHMSKVESGEPATEVDDDLLDSTLFKVDVASSWYRDILVLLSTSNFPVALTPLEKRMLPLKSKPFTLTGGELCKAGPDGILR